MKLSYLLTEKDSKNANPNFAFKRNLIFALIFYLFLIIFACGDLIFPDFQANLKHYLLPPDLNNSKEVFLLSILVYNPIIFIGGVTWASLFILGWAYFRLSSATEISFPGNYTLELKDGKIELENSPNTWNFPVNGSTEFF